MVSVKNSVNAKSVYDILMNEEHQYNSKDTTERLFDNFISIKKDLSSDITKNTNDINAVISNVKASTSDETAQLSAKTEAATLKKDTKYQDYTITADAKVSKNQVSFNIKDTNGKKGTASIKYGKDGSRVEKTKINNIETTKIYDKNGKLRKNTTVNLNKAITTIKEYDATGKINTATVKDTLTELIEYKNYYDDNGQLARKTNYNAEGIISSTVDYEYNKKGNIIGTYETIKSGSDKSEEVSAIATVIKSKTKKVITYNANETSTELTQIKNSKGKYVSSSKITYDKNGKKTEELTYTSTGKLKTKDNYTYDSKGNVLSHTQDNNNDGTNELKEVWKYTADGKIKTYTAGFNENNNGIFERKKTYKYDSKGKLSEYTILNDENESGRYEKKETFKYGSDGEVSEYTVLNDKNDSGTYNSKKTTLYKKGKITKAAEYYDTNYDGIFEEKKIINYKNSSMTGATKYKDSNNDGIFEEEIHYDKHWIKTDMVLISNNGNTKETFEYDTLGKISKFTLDKDNDGITDSKTEFSYGGFIENGKSVTGIKNKITYNDTDDDGTFDEKFEYSYENYDGDTYKEIISSLNSDENTKEISKYKYYKLITKSNIQEFDEDNDGIIDKKQTITEVYNEKTKTYGHNEETTTYDKNGNISSRKRETDNDGDGTVDEKRTYLYRKNNDGTVFNYKKNLYKYDDNGNVNKSTSIIYNANGNIKNYTQTDINKDGKTETIRDNSNNTTTIRIYDNKGNMTNEAVYNNPNKNISDVNRKLDEQTKQGLMGDCWLLSSVIGLNSTSKGKSILKNAIQPNLDGSVTVTFKGVSESYTISKEDMTAKNLDYSTGDNDMLAIEYATERLISDIKNNLVTVNDEKISENIEYSFAYESYSSLYKGGINSGRQSDFIYLLTGKKITEINKVTVDEISKLADMDLTFAGFDVKEGNYSIKLTNGENYTLNISGTHALAIKNIDKNAKTITFINPWDSTEEYTASWKAFTTLVKEGKITYL